MHTFIYKVDSPYVLRLALHFQVKKARERRWKKLRRKKDIGFYSGGNEYRPIKANAVAYIHIVKIKIIISKFTQYLSLDR